MLDALLALLVPPACVACRGPATGAGPLCAACRRGLRFLAAEDPCPRCALPRTWAGAHRCPAADAPWNAALAAVAYAGPAAAVVALLKDRGARTCADAMAAQILTAAPPGLLGPAVATPVDPPAAGAVLVPVPTHPWRARRRGHDQADLLTRALAARTGLPRAAVLRRRGPPTRQRGAARAARLQEGRVVLAARGPAPARVVLVDDVHTTGATLRAAAAAVRAAGAREVAVVTWARAL